MKIPLLFVLFLPGTVSETDRTTYEKQEAGDQETRNQEKLSG
jgi:hypothetical protein